MPVDHIEKPQKMVGSMVKYKRYMLMAVSLLDFLWKVTVNLLRYKRKHFALTWKF